MLSAVAFSPNGKMLAGGSYDRSIRVWETDNWQLKHDLAAGQFVEDLLFSPDGQRIVVVGNSGMLQVFDSDTGYDALTIQAHSKAVSSVDISSDGLRILTGGSMDGAIRIWTTRPAHPRVPIETQERTVQTAVPGLRTGTAVEHD